MATRLIADIHIGKRVRQAFGDINALAASIQECGLLQPIGIRPDGTLVCGERRIRACKKLRWTKIPVYVCRGLDDELQCLEAERDENTCREELSPLAARALQARLEPLYAQQAEAAQLAAGAEGKKGASHGKKGGRGRKKNPLPGTSRKGNDTASKETRNRAAKPTGYSDRTLKKVKQVEAAAKQDPAAYKDLLRALSQPGCRVDAIFRQHKTIQRAHQEQLAVARVAEAKTIEQALEQNTFPTIVADPPWDWNDEGDGSQFGRGRITYGAMSFSDLLKFPLGKYGDQNSHLYLWITNRSLPKGFALLDAWGYRYVTCLTWCKPSFGMGNYFRGSTEQVLFAVRGTLPLKRKNVGTWFSARRGKQHSAKPAEFYDLVQRCSPGPYLDLFARKPRGGWVTWGGELS